MLCCGNAGSTLSKIENGRRNIGVETLYAVAKALEVPLSFLQPKELDMFMPLVLTGEQLEPWLYDLHSTDAFLKMAPPQLNRQLLDSQIALW